MKFLFMLGAIVSYVLFLFIVITVCIQNMDLSARGYVIIIFLGINAIICNQETMRN